jgi:hypothetical protein
MIWWLLVSLVVFSLSQTSNVALEVSPTVVLFLVTRKDMLCAVVLAGSVSPCLRPQARAGGVIFFVSAA